MITLMQCQHAAVRKSKLSKLIKSIYNFYKKYEWHALKLKYLEAETYRYTVLL